MLHRRSVSSTSRISELCLKKTTHGILLGWILVHFDLNFQPPRPLWGTFFWFGTDLGRTGDTLGTPLGPSGLQIASIFAKVGKLVETFCKKNNSQAVSMSLFINLYYFFAGF